jgi:hypothetical protein
MLDTTNWASYPFTVNGVDFVSKVDKDSSMYKQVSRVPNDIFISMNHRRILELIGNPTEFSYDELSIELDRINEGASQALLCLA